ncbi:MAG: DUF2058 domain-containing protein [Gammaproteobacteria bacterium]|nr:DUF2058 domain-containing protein [Gammaproteobacteria bacterium]
MKNALQEQLIRAGLANEVQTKKKPKVKPAKNKKPKSKPKAMQTKKQPEAEPKENFNLQGISGVTFRLSDEEKAKRKAHKEKIKAFINEHKLNDAKAELPYNFVVDGKIKRLYVTTAQKEKIIKGEFAIILRNDRHWLLTLEQAKNLCELDPKAILFVNDDSGDQSDEDHPIPDDLVW